MPCNIALFDSDAASKIIEKYEYENWYLSGHSMGGAVATMYIEKNPENIKGAILLAAYPTNNMPDHIKLLSIYGSEDGVLNMQKYNESKSYWSENSKELVIVGGNHAQFGNYGKQNKDKEASISAENQQKQTIDSIIEFINA